MAIRNDDVRMRAVNAGVDLERALVELIMSTPSCEDLSVRAVNQIASFARSRAYDAFEPIITDLEPK